MISTPLLRSARTAVAVIYAIGLVVIIGLLFVKYWQASSGPESVSSKAQMETDLVLGSATIWLTLGITALTYRYANLTQRLVEEANRQATATSEQLDASNRQLDSLNRQIEISEAQVELGRLSLVAASRALLVDVPLGAHLETAGHRSVRFPEGIKSVWIEDRGRPFVVVDSQTHVGLHVPVRNVGHGTAFIVSVAVSSSPGVSWFGAMTPSIVPPAELAELSFAVPRNRPELDPLVRHIDERTSSVDVFITYTNSAGADQLRSCLNLGPAPADSYGATGMLIRQVSIVPAENTNDHPMVQSGPSGM